MVPMFDYTFTIEGLGNAVHVTAQSHDNDALALRVAQHLVDNVHTRVRVGRGSGASLCWLGEWFWSDGAPHWVEEARAPEAR